MCICQVLKIYHPQAFVNTLLTSNVALLDGFKIRNFFNKFSQSARSIQTLSKILYKTTSTCTFICTCTCTVHVCVHVHVCVNGYCK